LTNDATSSLPALRTRRIRDLPSLTSELNMCLAVPGRVLSVEGYDPLARSARVDFSGVVRAVNLAFVPEARAGDYVLVHVGVAIARIDEAEAQRLLATLAELDALEEGAP
jgi:hydrogenase expression/formation protein HypC